MDSRLSIVLVTRNFPPLVGGMENVNQRLLRELSAEWKVGLCGPAGSQAYAPEAYVVSETKIVPLAHFLIATLVRAITMTLRSRPEMLLAGSGLTLPIAWAAARLTGARLGVYLHGLDIIAPSKVYQLLWPRFFKTCDLVLVNSRSTAALAVERGAKQDRIHVLHPGTTIPNLDADARARFRSSLGFSSEPMLLSVGRLTKRKGLAEFVALAMPRILTSQPETKLVIVGEEAIDALSSTGESERERIQTAAQMAGVEGAVRFIGRLREDELGDAYQSADLHVFPVLQMVGDVEGFGMVALESAAHGLRTVAFAVGGVPDSVEDSVTGSLIPSGDYASFADRVVGLLRRQDTGSKECREFANGKSWDRFGERVRMLVNTALSRG